VEDKFIDAEFCGAVRRIIELGKAWLLRKHSERVSVLLVAVDGQPIKIVWDKQRKEVASAVSVSAAELSPCDCGHRHCHASRCSRYVVGDVEPKPCRCDHKCRCGLCLSYDESKAT